MNKLVHAPVLIVGAGLVGAAQALALAEYGIDCILLDKADLNKARHHYVDGRVSAISRASMEVLEHIGVWGDVVEDAGNIEKILVTENHKPSEIVFDAQAEGEEFFGAMVPNTLLRRALLEKAHHNPHITIISNDMIETIQRDSKVRIVTQYQQALEVDIVIVADGRYSKVRESIGITARKFEYDQSAIVCTVKHEKSHQRTAVEWFFPQGPLALLPMKDEHSSCIVLTEHTDMAEHLCAIPQEEFLEELQIKMQGAYGEIKLDSDRYSYPLNLFQAEAYSAHRALVIGDAAHAIHPIAGQGVNLGYRDVAVLTELLVDAFRTGQDLGSVSLAHHYERWRRFDAASMIATTDMLNRFFSNNSRVIRAVRRVGMRAFEKAAPVKSFFMMSAMGMEGDLPKMLQGQRI